MPEGTPEDRPDPSTSEIATGERYRAGVAEAQKLDERIKAPSKRPPPLVVARRHADQFLQDRKTAAETSAQITVLESRRTALRHEIIDRLMKGTPALSKTAATDQARTSPEYVEASKAILEETQRWEILFASAEHHRMLWKVVTLEVSRDYEANNAKSELTRLNEMIEQRIRTLNQED